MALELTEDARHGVARERPDIRVVAVERQNQTQGRNLGQILGRNAAVAVATGQMMG